MRIFHFLKVGVGPKRDYLPYLRDVSDSSFAENLPQAVAHSFPPLIMGTSLPAR